MTLKMCSKCGIEFPSTTEYFRPRKDSKDGMRNQCRKCTNQENATYRDKDKDKVRQRAKKYRENNKEKISKKEREYREKYRDKTSQYYLDNKDRILAQRKGEGCRVDKEKKKETSRKWLQKNRDKIQAYGQKRRTKKKQLPHTLTGEQWVVIKGIFNNKCAYCGDEAFLEQDHFVPLSNGGAFTHNNIIPACRACNSSKKDKSFLEWYPGYKRYSKQREGAILNFLGYKDGYQQLSIGVFA